MRFSYESLDGDNNVALLARMTANPGPQEPLPALPRQARNLAGALADFLADGCTLVNERQYRQRLEICQACEHRRGQRCVKCGCRLRWKARGRAFQCPAGKWPAE
jgi:hypothetical protein